VNLATPSSDRPRVDAWLRPERVRAPARIHPRCHWGKLAAGLATPGHPDSTGLLKGADFHQF
jgi:hypothetical protein